MMVNYTTETEKAWYKSPAIVDVGCVACNNLELNRKFHSDAPYRIVKPESKIQEEIEWYKRISEQFSAMSNPFDDLSYWSGFICQGLH